MATHTDAHISRVLEIFETVGKSVGLISGSVHNTARPQYGEAMG